MWKGLNKEWDLGPLGKHSGWFGALVGFAGKAGFDMVKKYGFAGKAEEAVDKAKAAIK